MNKTIVAVAFALLLSFPARAGIMHVTKAELNFNQLVAELEADTGLEFSADCATCTVHGYVSYVDGKVKVTVYEETHPTIVRIATATFNAALRTQITTTVMDHTP